ncbi:MAG: acyltransferase [Saprospiraceae bacterium]|nr:acyltransferase [Saprospiraceae bacterium]
MRHDWPLHFLLLLTNWLPDNVFFIRLRGAMIRPFFKKCGRKLGIGRNVTFYNPSAIEIGNWVYIAYGCWLQGGKGLCIEDEVLFGPYVVVTASNHTRQDNSWRFGHPTGEKITIGKGAWIGSHCSLLSGCQIGVGAMIGANTVVLGTVEEHTLFAGEKGSVKKQYEG